MSGTESDDDGHLAALLTDAVEAAGGPKAFRGASVVFHDVRVPPNDLESMRRAQWALNTDQPDAAAGAQAVLGALAESQPFLQGAQWAGAGHFFLSARKYYAKGKLARVYKDWAAYGHGQELAITAWVGDRVLVLDTRFIAPGTAGEVISVSRDPPVLATTAKRARKE